MKINIKKLKNQIIEDLKGVKINFISYKKTKSFIILAYFLFSMYNNTN